jgi:hypothetical protein
VSEIVRFRCDNGFDRFDLKMQIEKRVKVNHGRAAKPWQTLNPRRKT